MITWASGMGLCGGEGGEGRGKCVCLLWGGVACLFVEGEREKGQIAGEGE